mmetsp:Transcript_22145/g.87257  ORF Transcript_22145/g.87257 Transcript_22145/m.87257 type:complete len:134 (+) Transcript_22145:1580-1981(+)
MQIQVRINEEGSLRNQRFAFTDRFTLVSELLQNARRAGARSITVDHDAVTRTLTVRDNGRGIAPGDLAKERSFGIRGLHERAATVGGWVDLSAAPGGGTSLILSVPLAADAIDALDDETLLGDDTGLSIWGRA